MPERILVAVAWPYSNGPLHVGHMAGVYLPADIFARYMRLKGHEVLMVSGSDCHGTPITLRAESEGVSPRDVIERFHPSFINTLIRTGITFDLFTRTLSSHHYRVTQDYFLRLLERGHLFEEEMTSSYSETLGRFLPDRLVEGGCPHCGYARARGDQCDNCGRIHDAWQLVEPHSSLDGEVVTFRQTRHFFLDLAGLEPALRNWLDQVDTNVWRVNTLKFTLNWLREGLRGRAITRDLEWGVPVPVDDPEFAHKHIYVWFDAVIGYLSASLQWAQRAAAPESWREWWTPPSGDAPAPRHFYFIGKDNIPFHSIIWPAMLIGHGDLALPYNVLANEFMNLEGEQMSTSRNWAVWMPDLESRYAPDQIRYYLAANAPEGRDTNWSWADFVRRNNDELVATWGNLVNRVATIAFRNFGRVPEPGELTAPDLEVISAIEQGFDAVGELLERGRLKTALQEVMALAQRANQYVSEQRPWHVVKEDMERAASIVYTGLRLIDNLKTLFTPFLPHSSQRVHEMLGYEGVFAPQPQVEEADDPMGSYQLVVGDYRVDAKWEPSRLPVGQELKQPAPLFQKLDDSVAAEEVEQLRTQAGAHARQ